MSAAGFENRAVVLLSGGLDSATCLGVARARGYDVVAVSFDYAQRHQVELDAARRVAAHYGVKQHYVFELGSFRKLGGSSLTSDVEVPKDRHTDEMGGSGVPSTYVPARNLVFLSHAVGVAEVERCGHIFIGVNAIDYSGYPDCRPEFIDAFAKTANLATAVATSEKQALVIEAPLSHWSKADIIREGTKLGVPYELTHSCYSPEEGAACGRCDSCGLRLKGFAEAGQVDPIRYVKTDTVAR